MSSIQADVNEIRSIESELKILRQRIRLLGEKKKIAEQRITDFLNSKDQPGVKYQGTAIILDKRTKREYKNQKQKESDALSILKENGVTNPVKVYEEMIETMRGKKITISKIKMRAI